MIKVWLLNELFAGQGGPVYEGDEAAVAWIVVSREETGKWAVHWQRCRFRRILGRHWGKERRRDLI
jgi:hypothetical protein